MEDATRSRSDDGARLAAVGVVLFYNAVGVLDIVSTATAIDLGVAEEANPILRKAMALLGQGWVYAKVALQTVVTIMVLWFPHRYVLGLFALAALANAVVVYNNFSILFSG